MKSSERFKQTIKEYLEKRGSNDPLFARIVTKPGKNMDDCITYILNAVKKSECEGFTDDEIYNMVIHYFDENNIDIGNPTNCEVIVNYKVVLTDAEKAEAREKAMEELKNEIKAKAKKKSVIIKKDEKNKPEIAKSLF